MMMLVLESPASFEESSMLQWRSPTWRLRGLRSTSDNVGYRENVSLVTIGRYDSLDALVAPWNVDSDAEPLHCKLPVNDAETFNCVVAWVFKFRVV